MTVIEKETDVIIILEREKREKRRKIGRVETIRKGIMFVR